MILPLYQSRKVNPSDANPGLVYNKFLDKWPSSASDSDFKSLGGQEKTRWIDRFVSGGPYGKADVLKGASQRLLRLALANGARKPEIYTSTGPFVTGMGLSHPVENGFLWHHTLGVPYLPGSSVKGLIKAWARDWLEPDEEAMAIIDRLFGRDSTHEKGASSGSLIVFDALPVEPVNLVAEVLTPHDGGWRIATNVTPKDAPADWISPVPIPFLAVETGARLQFAFGVRANAEAGDLDLAYDYLSDALEWIGAGAKTAIGFGRFESDKRREELAIKAEAERPAQEGDLVEILPGKHLEKLNGRIGRINKVLVGPAGTNFAQISATDDGGKIKGTIELSSLRRLPTEDQGE